MEVDADLRAMAWSPDGRRLATGDNTGLVRVHDGEDGRVVKSFQTPRRFVHALAWSPNGKLVVTGNAADVNVWDAATGARALSFKNDHPVSAIAWSPDGTRLAAGSIWSLRLWDARSGKPGPEFPGMSDSLGWSREGGLLASKNDMTVRLIDASTEQPARILKGHVCVIASVAIDRTGRRVASAAHDHLLHVWDVDQGRPLWTAVFLSHDRVAVFSAAGELLHADPGAEDELIYFVEKEDEDSVALEVLTFGGYPQRSYITLIHC